MYDSVPWREAAIFADAQIYLKEMHMKKLIFVAVLLFGCCALAVAADAPKAEAFAGYSFYQCNPANLQGDCNLHGWIGSLSVNATKWLAGVGEFGGNYGSVGVFPSGKFTSFLFGPRVFYRRFEKITPFAHALVGDTYRKIKWGRETNTKENDLTLAVGGGLDLQITKTLAVRPFQLDYVTFDQKQSNRMNNFRFGAGIVFRLGDLGK
jgi:opacity protein-like surface antigen